MRSPREKRDFAEKKYNEGVLKMINKNYDKALMYFLWAIKECQDVEKIYVKRSECYMIIGDYIRALSDAHDALQLNPNSAEAQTRISDTLGCLEKSLQELILQKRFDDCTEIIEKAMRALPANEDLILISDRYTAMMIGLGYGADGVSNDDNQREISDGHVNLLDGSVERRGSNDCDIDQEREIPTNAESTPDDLPEKYSTPDDKNYVSAYYAVGFVTLLLAIYFLRLFS